MKRGFEWDCPLFVLTMQFGLMWMHLDDRYWP